MGKSPTASAPALPPSRKPAQTVTHAKRAHQDSKPDGSSLDVLVLEEQSLIDQGAENTYRSKRPTANKAVTKLNATIFPTTLFRNISSDRPLSQKMMLLFSTSNNVAPLVAHAMADFNADGALLRSLKLACATFPSLGRSLLPLADRIMAVAKATFRSTAHEETNLALITLATWSARLYNKCRGPFFEALGIPELEAITLCARFFLVGLEDLAFGAGFFSSLLSGELAIPMLPAVRQAVMAKYEFNYSGMEHVADQDGFSMDHSVDDSEAVNATKIKLLTDPCPDTIVDLRPPFTINEKLAFCSAFKNELKAHGHAGQFCIKKISATLPLRSDQDVINYYNANRHIYGLKLQHNSNGKAQLQHAPSGNVATTPSEHRAKRRKTISHGPTGKQAVHAAENSVAENTEATDYGTGNNTDRLAPQMPTVRRKGLTSAVCSGDLRSLARNLSSRGGQSDEYASEIVLLNEELVHLRSSLNKLIDKANDGPDAFDKMSDLQDEIKLAEQKLLYAKKEYNMELTRQLHDEGVSQANGNFVVQALRSELAEQKQQHRTEITELQRLQMSVVNQTRAHFNEELTSQKSAYEAKLRMRTIDSAAAFESGAMNGGHDPASASSDLTKQVEKLTQQLQATTLQLGVAQKDLDESRTMLADEQVVSSQQRETISKLQQSLQDLSIANANGESAYAALQNENRSLKEQNTSLARQAETNRIAVANSQSQAAQEQRKLNAIVNNCTSGAEEKLQKLLKAANEKITTMEQEAETQNEEITALQKDVETAQQSRDKSRAVAIQRNQEKIQSVGRREAYIVELKTEMLRRDPGGTIPDPKDGGGLLPRV